MKKKIIENLIPKKPTKSGWIATVQQVDTVLVINVYHNKILQGRYGMNYLTYEYLQCDRNHENWSATKFLGLLEQKAWYYSTYEAEKKLKFNSEEEEQMVLDLLKVKEWKWQKKAIPLIDSRETEYSQDKRERTEYNRINRVNAVMNQVPPVPEGIHEWIYERATGSADYSFFNKEENKWVCTGCGKKYDEKYLHRVDGEKKIRHNDMVICPRCKKELQVKKRTKKQEVLTHFMVLQPISDEISVARHFDAEIYWDEKGRHVWISESVRIVLNKGICKYACNLYYNQYSRSGAWVGGGYDKEYGSFDNKSNPANRGIFPGYLYEKGIPESLENTCYSEWTRLFQQMAAGVKKVQYNRLMIAQNNLKLIKMIECLFKGKFDQLLLESSESVSAWSCEYHGKLNLNGETMEDVFGIADRQKINRIRDLNGGEKILSWMRWSDETGVKIPQEVLEWLTKNSITRGDVSFIEETMSIQKIMNYVLRQQAEGYKGKSAKQVLSQWEDYLRMCKNQNKKMDDEMVYKPRELKRRHDEIVEEINKQRMLEEMKRSKKDRAAEAKRMRDRFPGAEENLVSVKTKYEYENENYKIIVPTKLIDIMTEGHALHHCVGATDRYFDRIMQQETYVVFLRKQSEPGVPYYTIEVEPGGTIRQSRGYLDEEPGIEEIRPFLREWQQVIKKRMKETDFKLAEVSAKKREANIEELKMKNNTRVLAGLMEDFMEAI